MLLASPINLVTPFELSGTTEEVPSDGGSRTLRITHRIDGVLTDLTSAALNDPDGTYGVRRVDTEEVIVPAGTPFVHDGVGLYSYTVTGLTTGVTYEAYVERVYLGEIKRTSITWIAGAGVAEGYYPKHAKMQLAIGRINLAIGSNLDGEGTDEDQAIIQGAMNSTDNEFDELAEEYFLPVVTPHMFLESDRRFGFIEDLASDVAAVTVMQARGLIQDQSDKIGGQLADLRQKALDKYKAFLAFRYQQQQIDASTTDGTIGAAVVTPACDPCRRWGYFGVYP